MDRRQFLKLISVISLGGTGKDLLANNQADLAHSSLILDKTTKYLILVEFKGGNDGLNTLIPYKDQLYYKNRPKIALKDEHLIKLSDSVAMHSALSPLKIFWEEKKLAWIQGVGYPEPNRSHFKSIDIWDTAKTEEDEQLEGWVTQYLNNSLKGVAINSNLGPLSDLNSSTISLRSLEEFIKLKSNIEGEKLVNINNKGLNHILVTQSKLDNFISDLLKKIPLISKPLLDFPKNDFGKDLHSVYTLIAIGLNIPAYKVSLGGFDTHVNQLGRQANLFKVFADGIAVLVENLKNLSVWENTMIMTYSEFGRRLQENASQGTDHGTAAPHMILGGSIKGGLYGTYPSLSNLDDRGDLIYTVDFRDIYSTIATNWWGKTTSGKMLNFI